MYYCHLEHSICKCNWDCGLSWRLYYHGFNDCW